MSDILGVDGLLPGQTTGTVTRVDEESDALAGLDYQAFLKLLVEQMKNQDPTEPMDSTDYMAQLATFANVEQNIRTNDRLEEILSGILMDQGSSLLGKVVSSADGSISGRVVSYEIIEGGVNLVLEDGQKLPLGPGVVVSEEGGSRNSGE
jgi:flagellar basal-body rod modification protein FlgD